MTDQRLTYLINRYLAKRHSAAELEELRLLVAASDDELLKESLAAVWDSYEGDKDMTHEKTQAMLAGILGRANIASTGRVRLLDRRWLRWSAAAVLLIGVSVMVLMRTNRSSRTAAAVAAGTDVASPQKSRATITLSDGRTIAVDGSDKGLLAQQGSVKLVKLADEQIAYQAQDAAPGAVVQYNTLHNPRGSKVIDMTLSDGSHVWLNAGSSITYPVAFTEKERRVTVTGEAYFEVTHDAKKPFRVAKGATEIAVLGTGFNVNAYDEEPDMKITLLTGAVDVGGMLLHPGEQAVVATGASGGRAKLNKDVDLSSVMAWKNGLFEFDGTEIKDVMRQLERWYDLEVVYEGPVPAVHLGGEMKRDLSLAQVMRGLGRMGIHFRIEDKKLIVMQ